MSKLLITRRIDVIDHHSTGRMMREYREHHGISIREVARRMGLSAAYVSDLERGRRNWKLANAERYQQAVSANQQK